MRWTCCYISTGNIHQGGDCCAWLIFYLELGYLLLGYYVGQGVRGGKAHRGTVQG